MLGSATTTGTMPRVNLLPPEIAEKATLRKAQFAMLGVGAAAAAVVGVMYVNASAKVADANEAKAEAVAQGTKLNSELAQLRNVSEVYAQVDAAKATLASAMSSEILWSSYLHNLTLTIPENVWVTSFTATSSGPSSAAPTTAATTTTRPVLDGGIGVVTINGTALDHEDVAAWLESLSRQKGYANAYFTQAIEKLIGDRVVVNFTSSVNITPAALSNRYPKGTVR